MSEQKRDPAPANYGQSQKALNKAAIFIAAMAAALILMITVLLPGAYARWLKAHNPARETPEDIAENRTAAAAAMAEIARIDANKAIRPAANGPLMIYELDQDKCAAKAPYAYRVGLTFGNNDKTGSAVVLICASHELLTADDFHALDAKISVQNDKSVIMGINRLPGNDDRGH